MARRTHDDALGVAGAETVIGAGVNVKGSLLSDADIIIDGTLNGSIKTSGSLTIGVNAHITANVQATNVVIAGTLKGNVACAGEATIRETGRVEGDIVCSGLAINSGGIFVGTNKINEHEALDSDTLDLADRRHKL